MAQSSSSTSTQIAEEQARVAVMYECLDARVAAVKAQLAEALREPVGDATALYEREVATRRLVGELRDLGGAEPALCFGRIDAADTAGGAGRETVYVGRIGLRDGEGGSPVLVDWRADAARPFYAATLLRPMGLRRRRHLRLNGRTVRDLNDEILDGSAPGPDDVPGDGPLAEALAAKRTGRMRAAAATLQAEQDAIVRSPHRGVTVVQGGPGTGKTIVALHRAAYVLFAFARVAEEGVLVVAPSPRFLDYISHVLPSLGENDVCLATLDELAGVESTGVVPVSAARLKGRADLADGLAAWVRSNRPAPEAVTLPVGTEQIELDGSAVAEALASARGLPHNPGRTAFKEYLVAELVHALERKASESIQRFEAELADLVGFDLDEAVAADLRALGFDTAPAGTCQDELGDELDREMVRTAFLHDPRIDAAIESCWPRLTPADVVRGLLSDPAALAAHLPSLDETERSHLLADPHQPWSAADLPLLDEASELLDGPPGRTYGHVVVDEAQELTEMDWRMVMRRCPSRSMTIVGDFAQAGPSSTLRTWQSALGRHVGTRFDLHTLTINYRTTAEVLESTRELLTSIAPEQILSTSLRHGPDPRVLTISAPALLNTLIDEVRAQAAAHPGELTAVICADDQAAGLTDALRPQPALVVPASSARGLEFDSVLVVSPEEILAARPSGRRDLYVALTRTTKRLCTIHISH
ncbi:HelD family protein [Flindersiella endophytica]